MDPRLQQANQGKKQKQHQTSHVSRGCALVLGRDFLCAPWTTLWKLCAKIPPPRTSSSSLTWPPRCLRGEVKAAEMEVGVAPERCGSGQCSSASSPCIASKFKPRVGEVVRGGADVTPQAVGASRDTSTYSSRTAGQGCSRPTFSFLLWWNEWEKGPRKVPAEEADVAPNNL